MSQKQIMDYKTITSTDPKTLDKEIKAYLRKNGWSLHGHQTTVAGVNCVYYTQVMVLTY